MKKHRKIELTATTKLRQIGNLKVQSTPRLKYTILEWKRANGQIGLHYKAFQLIVKSTKILVKQASQGFVEA